MTTFRHALILVPAALLLTGAKPADSLRATFVDPGAEYRPVPFWHLNGRVEFIQAKMDKMDRFVERAIGAQVTLRIDKDDEQGNKVAIVKIDVAGDELLAERRCKTFEEAIDLCLDAIKKQIDKYKEKRR